MESSVLEYKRPDSRFRRADLDAELNTDCALPVYASGPRWVSKFLVPRLEPSRIDAA